MDLELSSEDLAFQTEARAFLDEHLTPVLRAVGARVTSVFCEPRHRSRDIIARLVLGL